MLVTGNVRTSDDVIRREVTLKPGKPLGDDALVESQRRLAALGLFRRVRHRRAAARWVGHRDVLVEVEEAPSTTVAVRRRGRGGAPPATGRSEGGPAEERIEIAPRGFFQISRRNLWGKNRTLAVDARQLPAARSGRRFRPIPPSRRLRLQRIPRARHVSGAAACSTRRATCSSPRFLEQAVRHELQFQPSGRASRIRQAAWQRCDGQRPLGARRDAAVRRRRSRPRINCSSIASFRRFGCRRSPARFFAIRATTCWIPSAAAVLGFDTTLAARALGSEVGFVKSFRTGLRLSSPTGRAAD